MGLAELRSARDGLGPHGFLPARVPAAPAWSRYAGACRELPARYHGADRDVRPWLAEAFADWSEADEARLAGLGAAELDDLMAAVSTLAHAYRWAAMPAPAASHALVEVELPRGLAGAWDRLAARLDVPRCGNLYHMILHGWGAPDLEPGAEYATERLRRDDPARGAVDLAPIHPWLRGREADELAVFAASVVRTEAQGALAVDVMVPLLTAVAQENVHEITYYLDKLAAITAEYGQIFARAIRKQQLAPRTFLTLIQPHFVWGLEHRGALLEGASGAQAPSFQLLDAVLSVPRHSHAARSALHGRAGLPPQHRRFLAALDALGPELRRFVDRAGDRTLAERFNECVRGLQYWRRIHQKRGGIYIAGDPDQPAARYVSVGRVVDAGEDAAARFDAAMEAHVQETAQVLFPPERLEATTLESALRYLKDADLAALLAGAVPRSYPAGAEILAERSRRAGLFIIRGGAARVVRVHRGVDIDLARMVPGELIGELSFLENVAASATVLADAGGCDVDLIPAEHVLTLLGEPAFAARFFQSLASYLARRQRTLAGTFPELVAGEQRQLLRERLPAAVSPASPVPEDMQRALARFAAAMPGARDEAGVAAACDDLLAALARRGGDAAEDLAAAAEVFRAAGVWLWTSELLAWMLRRGARLVDVGLVERAEGPPRGRDVQARGVDAWARGLPTLRWVLQMPGWIAAAIDAAIAVPGAEASVAFLEFGPDWSAPLRRDGAPLHLTCFDFDPGAHAWARAQLGPRAASLRLVHGDISRLARGQGRLTLAPQQVIVAGTLLLRLDDREAVEMLSWIHAHLRDDGVVLGACFDPAAPDRAFVDRVLQASVHRRQEAELAELFLRSDFGSAPLELRSADGGAAWLVRCRKRPARARAGP